MRLDHVSYVASHDQVSDVINRIGSQIGTAFVDGGIHPKFGTRNFTAPLLNGQYIEIVCPLDHPATDATPFGQAVKKKADAGGGWLTWVFSTNDLAAVEEKFGRKSIVGSRTKPDGTELKWKQIGVKEILVFGGVPYFIQWQSELHPSSDGNPNSSISKIYFNQNEELRESWFTADIIEGLGEIELIFINSGEDSKETGILALEFNVNGLEKKIY
jgi:hypothetical protein